MQQKQEYEAQMALSGIGKSLPAGATMKSKNVLGSNSNIVKEEMVPNRPPSISSQTSQNTPTQSPLPQPLSHLKVKRLSQDSDKTDISQQSSDSDRIILESNDDEEDEDDDDKDTEDKGEGRSDDSKKEKEKSDNGICKNIEIRRMSSTDDGDKVLQSAWTSPEKAETGKTPLEMVQNIVSSIDSPSVNDKNEEEENSVEIISLQKNKETIKTNISVQQMSGNSAIPSWIQSSGKPLMHSHHLVANQTPPSNLQNPLLLPAPQPPVTSVIQTTVAQAEQNTIVSGQIHSNSLAPSGSPVIFGPATNQPQTMTPVQMATGVGQPQVPSTQPSIMQIVNTLNGPMLMQAFPAATGVASVNGTPSDQSNPSVLPSGSTMVLPTTNGCYQRSPLTTVPALPPKQQQEPPNKSSFQDEVEKNGDEDNDQMVSKKTRKGKKKKNDPLSASPPGKDSQNPTVQYQPPIAISQHSQMPILVTNAGNNAPTSSNNQSHILALGQPGSGPALLGASPSPQTLQPLIMNQPGTVLTNVNGQVLLSNGSFMAVPAIYNQQMPDGSIVQVQNGLTQIPSAPIIQQGGQPMLAGNGAGPIMMTPQGSGQFVPSAGTFIMTPQGLVPAAPTGVPANNPSQPNQPQAAFPQGNFVAIAPSGAPNQQLQQVTISPAHTPTLVQQQPTPPPTQIPQQPGSGNTLSSSVIII